ncbi:PEP-CTERM/exosortase system-associated acyltransferase [Agarivorans sp. MS3-6]|uniref:PEP-CTERM/exosortase system-associated acyltransferase n=1 Tax=Agarivorans sp. TSD2052 TaxID=2937286 RepID=UPI00200CD52D|nr:PEP-CTERM/exosortase system-associated acyltransferase [Agarivorans sp. TSD2052]UPW18917.1 PEP-CTERM/exosortase system-associated acyltransferase [Agarivorans sp. TSD2052]
MSNQTISSAAPPILRTIVPEIKQQAQQGQGEELAQRYQRYFQAGLATSEREIQRIYQLRHRVYCEEFHFEPSNTSKMETDQYDSHSQYCHVQHLNSGLDAGCLRLISPSSTQSLPLLDACGLAINHPQLHPNNFSPDSICEVSRVALDSRFRRRKIDNGGGANPVGIGINPFSEKELRTFPYISMSLYLAASVVAQQSGIKHAYLMVEPRLARSLSLLGIKMTRISPNIDYHGIRAAYHVTIEHFQQQLPVLFQPLLTLIEHSFKPNVAFRFEQTNDTSALSEAI